jgi:hypothetical protein
MTPRPAARRASRRIRTVPNFARRHIRVCPRERSCGVGTRELVGRATRLASTVVVDPPEEVFGWGPHVLRIVSRIGGTCMT